MEEQLKDLIIKLAKTQSWGQDADTWEDSELYDTFEECTDIVWRGTPDKHRWYTITPIVRALDTGKIIRYFQDKLWFAHNENSSIEDCGWSCPDLNDLVRVYPKEVTTIAYVTADKL